MEFILSKEKCDDLSKQGYQGILCSIKQKIEGDFEIPQLYSNFLEDNFSFLLESHNHQSKAKNSIIGISPHVVYTYAHEKIKIQYQYKTKEVTTKTPLDFLNEQWLYWKKNIYVPKEEKSFLGLYGYIGYAVAKTFEPKALSSISTGKVPDMLWMLPQFLLIFDHQEKTLTASGVFFPSGDLSYTNFVNKLKRLLETSSKKNDTVSLPKNYSRSKIDLDSLKSYSSWKKEDFLLAVKKAKNHIEQGDIFQIVLSIAFKIPMKVNPFYVYLYLRNFNPSPYMFFFKTPFCTIGGASPETMLRCIQNTLYLKPIAGTRPRGKTKEEDKKLADELACDIKEIAEHMMLLDLGRNDLGRIAKKGTVKLLPDGFKKIEYYSHVMHLVSELEASLDEKHHYLEALVSTLPAGTLSGAPKIKAMQLIESLEPTPREVYGGTVGYLTLQGDMDTCIAIRSFTCHEDTIKIQAGAGIVYDSIPQKEYEEVLHKLHAVAQAIVYAHEDKGYKI